MSSTQAKEEFQVISFRVPADIKTRFYKEIYPGGGKGWGRATQVMVDMVENHFLKDCKRIDVPKVIRQMVEDGSITLDDPTESLVRKTLKLAQQQLRGA